MGERKYKYERQEFGDLPVTLHHLTMHLNFFTDWVEVENCLEMTARIDVREITLDAYELDILKIAAVESSQGGRGTPLPYEYCREDHKLVVRLSRLYRAGESFMVRTLTKCFPSDHVLEGIYRDTTPPGAPQQFMSQCQQWGFQRIMPIFDDCRAKFTMTVTLEGDASYTHLISNGNVNRLTNPDGRPVPKPSNPGRQVITFENAVPMAPYLFLAIAGTWDDLVDEVTYPSGQRVRLEYLVPPGRTAEAQLPLDILKKAVLWVERTQDYEYSGDTYRTICMDKSNFGGMENLGNTTIVTDAALIGEHTLDDAFIYAHGVIAHEFEHNQCGSETTMETPFDVWLNEAYTVDVERQFLADLFDPTFIRLREVDKIRNPLLGPLAVEDSGRSGRIVRDGFNSPEELIDNVTYVKAAEIIRMLRLVLGPQSFHEGKHLYFSRYRYGNANTDQFFECFEEASGMLLQAFKKQWLHTIGYPQVKAETFFEPETQSLRVLFRQELPQDVDPFHIPIEMALVDHQGLDLPGTQRVFQLTDHQTELSFDNLQHPPAFVSMNRDYSFYGTFWHSNVSLEELMLQVRLDSNFLNRIEAMRLINDRQRLRIMQDPEAEIDSWWPEFYGEILKDVHPAPALKAYFLRIDEQPLDRRYSTWYNEQVTARDRLMTAVNLTYRSELLEQFHNLDTYTPRQSLRKDIEARLLKAVLLELIAIEDSSSSHRVILDHYHAATTATDRVQALVVLNRSSAPERLEILEEVYQVWHRHLSGYANYLRVISSGTCNDVFDLIEREKRRSSFDIKHPTWSRALFVPMAENTRMLWTDNGIHWLVNAVIELAYINTTIASRLLNAFQHASKLKPLWRDKVFSALEEILRMVPDTVCPTIYRQARAYLELF